MKISATGKISKATLTGPHQHLWYLNQKMVSLCFFSKLVSIKTKCLIFYRLRKYSEDHRQIRSIKYEGNYNNAKKSLDSFTSLTSYFLFRSLKLHTTFLKDVKKWKTRK